MAETARVWTVLSREQRLVLAVSDEPGVFNFAKPPDDDVAPIECAFATVQCYDVKLEPDMLNLLLRSRDVEEFVESLADRGYIVFEGRPRASRISRL